MAVAGRRRSERLVNLLIRARTRGANRAFFLFRALSATLDSGVATLSSDLRSASTPQIAAITAAASISPEPTR